MNKMFETNLDLQKKLDVILEENIVLKGRVNTFNFKRVFETKDQDGMQVFNSKKRKLSDDDKSSEQQASNGLVDKYSRKL